MPDPGVRGPSFAAPPPSPAPPSTSGLAVAALVLGILALLSFWLAPVGIVLGVLAVLFGAMAMGRTKEGGQGGRGMAIAGLVTGIVGLVGALLMLTVFVKGIQFVGDVIRAQGQMQTLSNHVREFEEKNGRLPNDLDEALAASPAAVRNDPWGNPYHLRALAEGRYEIVSSGMDGVAGTADDLRFSRGTLRTGSD
jgi:hypothetical protein